jgi:hypothetical protein
MTGSAKPISIAEVKMTGFAVLYLWRRLTGTAQKEKAAMRPPPPRLTVSLITGTDADDRQGP